jgi:hypothetical protein
MWMFMTRRSNFRGIDLYKNCIYEADANLCKVFIRNKFAVAVDVDYKTKWTLKQSEKEYLSAHPTGPQAMKAKQLMALARGVVMLPSNYKENPPEPVILDKMPHAKRKEETKEPVVVEDADPVSE